MDISHDQMEEIAKRAVKAAFRDIGISDEEAFEMRRDFEFLRQWRETCEAVRTKGFATSVGLTITGVVALIVLGIRHYLNLP